MTRGPPSYPNRPDCPRQLRMISQTAGQRPGRANADRCTEMSKKLGRSSWGRAHLQKTSNFLTGCLVRTHRDSFFPRAFFYSPHSPHFFRQKLSGRLGMEKRISIRKWRSPPMETYLSKDLLPKAYFTDQTSPEVLTRQAQKPRYTHIYAYIRIIRIYTHIYAYTSIYA